MSELVGLLDFVNGAYMRAFDCVEPNRAQVVENVESIMQLGRRKQGKHGQVDLFGT